MAIGRIGDRSERLDIADQLPPLWFGELRPYRHAAANDAVGQEPEDGARSGLLHGGGKQAGGFLAAFGHLSVALGAVQVEEVCACRQGLIDRLDLMHINGEGHYYERRLGRDHIHMACLRCGKITEFVSDGFEKLKQQVEKDCRFRVLVSRLEIGGYCADCRGSK